MMPLFIQWSDYTLMHRSRNSSRNNNSSNSDRRNNRFNEINMFQSLIDILRDDILYITVSQANKGLEVIERRFSNVLVLSGGGEGHIPIPLIKGLIPYKDINYNTFPKYNLSFFGTFVHGSRRKRLIDSILVQLNQKYSISAVFGVLPTWKDDAYNSAFNLIPEGFGRATFRLAEIIQMGRIPVLVYDDVPWIPYQGTIYSVEYLGLVIKGNSNGSDYLLKYIHEVSINEVYNLLERVKQARYYYTLEGVIDQIKAFFNDPLGPTGGYLRCSRTPNYRDKIFVLSETQQNM
jgi:hypothetical protein